MDMQLTENFWLSEFLHSQTAERDPDSYPEQLSPSPDVIESLRYLCENSVQPLRTLLKVPMKVSSGYRCEKLNKAIGGSAKSQHVKGEAVDLILSDSLLKSDVHQREKEVIQNMVYARVGKWMRDDLNSNFYLFAAACLYLNELDIDQLIHEYGSLGRPAWVHMSASRTRNNRQILLLPQKQTLNLEEALLLGC